MKAERTEPKQEFVPVIVTLESQEEVDSLFALTNHFKIVGILPALDGWWSKLTQFTSRNKGRVWSKLNDKIR